MKAPYVGNVFLKCRRCARSSSARNPETGTSLLIARGTGLAYDITPERYAPLGLEPDHQHQTEEHGAPVSCRTIGSRRGAMGPRWHDESILSSILIFLHCAAARPGPPCRRGTRHACRVAQLSRRLLENGRVHMCVCVCADRCVSGG